MTRSTVTDAAERRDRPSPALVVLAAGRSTRFGRPKHREPLGPSGETLVDYVLHDAVRAGCRKVVFVVSEETRPEVERRAHRLLASTGVESLFAHQEMEDLPGGRAPPPGRTRPWGTGHAVLAASPRLQEDFLVANIDDFYWPEAYEALVGELGAPAGDDPCSRPRGAVAAYTLADTLSRTGPASRALLEVGDGGFLAGVTEAKEVRPDGAGFVGRTLDGRRLSLSGDEPVSMNLWALERRALPALREELEVFLDRHGDDPDAEFLLSEALDRLVRAERVRIRLCPVRRAGFGITFPSDVEAVRKALREAVRAVGYPENLGAALSKLAPRRPGEEHTGEEETT